MSSSSSHHHSSHTAPSSSSSHHHSSSFSHRRSSRDRSRSRSKSRSRSRSRSKDRTREREKHSKRSRHSRSRSRSRSRTRSRSRSRSPTDRKREKDRDRRDKKDKKEKKEKKDKKEKKEKKSDKDRDLERQLKLAKKLLSKGKDASAVLDSAALEKMLAEEKQRALKAVDDSSSSDSDSGKKSKKKKKRRQSSSDDDSDSSSSDSDEDSGPAFLSDGKTPRLTKRDYFSRNVEFRVWLHRTHSKHLDDVSSTRARRYFKQFCRHWNEKKLSDEYYKGMDSTNIGAGSLTKHQWKFTAKLTDAEKEKLHLMKDQADTSTFHHSYAQEFGGAAASASRGTSAPSAAASASVASRTPMDRVEQKRFNSMHKAVLDELVPKPEGREAQLEKKKQKGSYARNEMDTTAEVSDKDLMGSSGQSEYQQLLQKQRAQDANRAKENQNKLSDYQSKEKEKMKNLLTSLGLQDKYPM